MYNYGYSWSERWLYLPCQWDPVKHGHVFRVRDT